MNYWQNYQIVHFHRNFGDLDQCPTIIKSLRSLGIIVIADIDDYWLPTKEHPIHNLIINDKMHLKIVENLKASDYVTTTTEIFANEIRKFNKNVIVFPNAIDPKEGQFTEPTLPSDKVRVGWLGGSSHLHDLKLLDGMVNKLSPLQEKLQYYLCGFDTRGSVTEINKDTGEKRQRPIKPQETVWSMYEHIFTDNYKIISPEYKLFLDGIFGIIAGTRREGFKTHKALSVLRNTFVWIMILSAILMVEKGFSGTGWLSEVIVVPFMVFQLVSALKNASMAGYIKMSLLNEILDKIDNHKGIRKV